MARLYVFNKATSAVVAIIEGPDGASCEHAAGKSHCSPELGWQYTDVGLVMSATASKIQAKQLG